MSEKQTIISIGREVGSGGHTIAEMLSNRFNYPLYDFNILTEIVSEKNLHLSEIEKYDESPQNRLLSRTRRGYNNSPEVHVANLQFDYLRKKAAEGKSFVVVGRCSETVLKCYSGLISFFILGDMEHKIERISELHGVPKDEAADFIIHLDKKRKAYHNYHCVGKWGDSRNYDFSINSSRLGIEQTVDVIENYIKKRQSLM